MLDAKVITPYTTPPSITLLPTSSILLTTSTTTPFASPFATPYNHFGTAAYTYSSSLYGGVGMLGGYSMNGIYHVSQPGAIQSWEPDRDAGTRINNHHDIRRPHADALVDVYGHALIVLCGIGRTRDTHGHWEIGISVWKAEQKQAYYDRTPRCCVQCWTIKVNNLYSA